MARWIIEITTNILPQTTASNWRQHWIDFHSYCLVNYSNGRMTEGRRRRRSFLLMHFTDPSSSSRRYYYCGLVAAVVERRPQHLIQCCVAGICQSSSFKVIHWRSDLIVHFQLQSKGSMHLIMEGTDGLPTWKLSSPSPSTCLFSITMSDGD